MDYIIGIKMNLLYYNIHFYININFLLYYQIQSMINSINNHIPYNMEKGMPYISLSNHYNHGAQEHSHKKESYLIYFHPYIISNCQLNFHKWGIYLRKNHKFLSISWNIDYLDIKYKYCCHFLDKIDNWEYYNYCFIMY